ncbi:MAG: hypothetical protein J6036_05150 [Clostridia bacterium]|nr:hypothetical protein [Clostridia bacterium]
MGLDQYLRAKTSKLASKPSRGACGGLFPIEPADNGTTEIGYWRKAYSVSAYLREKLDITHDFNLEDKESYYEQILSVLDYAEYILDNQSYEDEYEKYDWENTVKAFTAAKEILEEDHDAQIFYMEWY